MMVTNEMFLGGWDEMPQAFLHLSKNVKTEINPSPIHGVGVFAIRDIQKGEQVFEPWAGKTGIYLISDDLFYKLNPKLINLINRYFITIDCGYKVIRLFNGINFVSHTICFCNSSYPNESDANIGTDGIALRDIKDGEEILEYYSENI
jgi:hypothetical protein